MARRTIKERIGRYVYENRGQVLVSEIYDVTREAGYKKETVDKVLKEYQIIDGCIQHYDFKGDVILFDKEQLL